MVNKYRGEVEAVLDGSRYRLVLTLGALAELEAAFGEDDLVALASRFDNGRLKARDCVRIIGAGLRGAGYSISDQDVAGMQAEAGAAGFVSIVAELLAATFAAGSQGDGRGEDQGGVRAEPGPFPGTT